MDEIYRAVKRCRICNSEDMIKYLDLGNTPLANSLLDSDRNNDEMKFPLEVIYCKNCSLSQLSIVVNPKIMFSNYLYHSSVSKTFQEHCSQIAKEVSEAIKPDNKGLAVDIASNDGCLLQQFKKEGFKTLGVEPAQNIANIANSNGIETLCSFWDVKTANKILEKYGQARIITATNVLAHVDDLNEFLKAVGILLDNDGFFIVEVPYLYDLLANNEFDTIYHEHLSYFLIKPLKELFGKNNLCINNIKKFPIHGGSLRIFASKKDKEDKSVQDFIDMETKGRLHDIKTYESFNHGVQKIKEDLIKLLENLKNKNSKVAAYGASAKGNTLLNYCDIDNSLINFIIDDTPQKQNHFAPGSGIKIVDSSYLEKEKPGYLLMLAWNFAEEIKKKVKETYKGEVKYIMPIPEVRVE